MVKRLLDWLTGLLRPKIGGPLGDIRLDVISAEGKSESLRFVAGRSRREAVIPGYCTVDRGDE